MSHNTRAQHARSVTIDEGTTHRMSPVRLPRRTRTISALALVAGAATLSLAGCTSAGSVDGAYIKIAETSGISSAWVIKGDSIQFVNGSCSQYDLDDEPAFLSEGLTRITDPVSGDNYALAWYEDKTGFVWGGHGDFHPRRLRER